MATTTAEHAHGVEITTTGLIGYGANLAGHGRGIGGMLFPLNDHGIVAIQSSSLLGSRSNEGSYLTNGDTYNLVGRSFGSALELANAFTINNSHVLTYALGPVPLGGGYQLFELAPPYSISGFAAASAPFVDPLYGVDTNSAGLGVALLQTPRQVIRLNGDGTTTPLDIDPTYLGGVFLAGPLSTPRILDDGSIYVGLQNVPANTLEIWRFPPGQTTGHTVVYSTAAATAELRTWGVNQRGDLVLVLTNGEPASWLERRPASGVAQVVGGSLIRGAQAAYQIALLNTAGMIAAVRSIGAGRSELVYADAGGSVSPVLATGDTVNGGRILTMNPASDMNEWGQLTLSLQIEVAPSDVRFLAIRVNPPGADKGNPIPPDPCAIGRGWCFDRAAIAILVGRATYYDPPPATGYEYVASSNAFTGVEVPFPYGDGRFDLYVWDETSSRYVDTGTDIVAGEYLSFDRIGYPNGLTRFALHGIEADAAVDPADPRGFVTGLTFLSPDTRVRFSMIPIVAGSGDITVGPDLGPVKAWIGLANSDAVGLRVDLRAQVYADSTLIGAGQVNNVATGSSGFNRAVLQTIPLALSNGAVDVPEGTALAVDVSVRRTCVGGGHNSGTVRLWYDGQLVDSGGTRDAGSRFDATIDGASTDYFLRKGSALSETAGTSRTFADATVNSRQPCPARPYTSVGTWSLTLP